MTKKIKAHLEYLVKRKGDCKVYVCEECPFNRPQGDCIMENAFEGSKKLLDKHNKLEEILK